MAANDNSVLSLKEMEELCIDRPLDNAGEHDMGKYEEMDFTASCKHLDYTHAAHMFLYAPNDEVLWEVNKKSAAILMQMRFDGQLGFTGGLLDSQDEAPHIGLNRELNEEIGLDTNVHGIKQEDHLVSHVNHKCHFVTHFYAKRFTMDEFLKIERGAQKAQDWGGECLGTIRVPLYRMPNKKTGLPSVRGLPTFLSNKFAGNARHQLVYALYKLNVIPHQELSDSLHMSAKLRGVS